MNFLLDINNIDITAPIDDLGDKLLYGGRIFLIGIATVFAVLIILWLILILFKLFFNDLVRSAKKTKVEKVEQVAVTAVNSPSSDNEEIIAVIAAAIAMAENDCGGNKKFRVVSFKRK